MTETSWQKVVETLTASVAGPTDEQKRLAALVGVELESWPRPVCAVVLRRALAAPLQLAAPRPVHDASEEFCSTLAAEYDVEIPSHHLYDRGLIDAWIITIYDKRAAEALCALQPEVGDIVERLEGTGLSVGEVSSISSDGRLNFKGGFGRGVRPHRARIRNRKSGDADAWAAGRKVAQQQMAQLDPNPERIGVRERKAMDPHRVEDPVSETAVLALREAVETAEDEKPLQHVIEQFPQLLAHLVDHTQGAWVLPRPSLDGFYVPDFLVAAETSLGVRWLFVELESPTHRLETKAPRPGKSGLLSHGVRTGIAQINEWREWVQNNLAHARQPVAEGGLGLAGIRPDARGLVLVGRGHVGGDPDPLRSRTADRDAIEVRTYDWLMRAVLTPRVAGMGLMHLDDEENEFFS